MNEFRDSSDVPPAPRVTSAASLWLMFVVIVLVMSAIAWPNPAPEKEVRIDAHSPATQATVKPPAKPGSQSSV